MGAMKEHMIQHCGLWADLINDWYGIDATGEEVENIIWDEQVEIQNQKFDTAEDRKEAFEHSLMAEVQNESYTDTLPRETMVNEIAKSRIGMEYPCGMDTNEYTEDFREKMEKFLTNRI